ncbi:MAG: hypothetical protein KDA64_05080, partial [Rhodospirillaceae bacterium]|nr:hypothetical protein [Rhodospirillaceae bacterium]
WLFGEDQARYLIAVADAGPVLARAAAVHAPAQVVGRTGGAALKVSGQGAISVAQLTERHRGWLPALMAGPAADTPAAP